MTGCPSPECHEQLQEVRRAIYGEDGKGGILTCLKDKVPKKWLWTALGISLIPSISFTASVWYKTQASDLMYAPKTAVTELASKVNLLEYKDQELRAILQRIEENQIEMQKDIKKLLEERSR